MKNNKIQAHLPKTTPTFMPFYEILQIPKKCKNKSISRSQNRLVVLVQK